MPLKIVRNNIIDMHADAIVNTANQHTVVGSGKAGLLRLYW